jgi:hypothetical protein
MYIILRTRYPDIPIHELIPKCIDLRLKCEGDDGVFLDYPMDQKYVRGLGLNLKIDHYTHFSEASFCGIICDTVAYCNVTNPYKAMADFALLDPKWAESNVSKQMDLVRSKAISYAFAYNGCPVISSLAHYALRVTRGRDVTWTIAFNGKYHADETRRLLKMKVWDNRKPILPETRSLVERIFGMDVDTQIAVENYFDSIDVIQPLNPPCKFPDLWVEHARKYATRSREKVWYIPKDCDLENVRRIRECSAIPGNDRPKPVFKKSVTFC